MSEAAAADAPATTRMNMIQAITSALDVAMAADAEVSVLG